MKKANNYIALILIFLLTSCVEREIDYDFDFGKPGIVVSGVLTQEGVQVYLQYTVNPMVPSNDLVNDATVLLCQDSKLIIKLIQSNPGHYSSPDEFTPTYNNLYYLKVISNDGDTLISNKQELVRPVIIDTCYYKLRTYNKGKDYVFMEFNDPADQKNFYVYYQYDEYGNGQLLPSHGNQDLIGTPINDELFNGQEKTFVYSFVHRYSSNGEFYNKDSILLKLHSYSEDFALYLNGIADSKFTYGDFFFDQPIFPKSYIQNGYGIFGSYTVDTYMLDIEEDGRD